MTEFILDVIAGVYIGLLVGIPIGAWAQRRGHY